MARRASLELDRAGLSGGCDVDWFRRELRLDVQHHRGIGSLHADFANGQRRPRDFTARGADAWDLVEWQLRLDGPRIAAAHSLLRETERHRVDSRGKTFRDVGRQARSPGEVTPKDRAALVDHQGPTQPLQARQGASREARGHPRDLHRDRLEHHSDFGAATHRSLDRLREVQAHEYLLAAHSRERAGLGAHRRALLDTEVIDRTARRSRARLASESTRAPNTFRKYASTSSGRVRRTAASARRTSSVSRSAIRSFTWFGRT